MIDIVNNIEFTGCVKKSIVTCDMFIKVDEENKLLLASDIVDNEKIDISSEGILKEVNSYIALKIEDKLNINVVDYGVTIIDESISATEQELENVF